MARGVAVCSSICFGGVRVPGTASQVIQEWTEPGGPHPPGIRTAREERCDSQRGEKLILEPVTPKSLLEVLASLAPIDEELPPIPDPPPHPAKI